MKPEPGCSGRWQPPVFRGSNRANSGPLTTNHPLTPKGERENRSALLARAVVFGALLSLVGCKGKPHATPPPPPTVAVTTVTQADVPIYHEWIGVLDGLVNAHIRAQVSGYLMSQKYREGDPIKKGDLLFEIDSRPFQAALDQAKGQLAQAEAKLGKAANCTMCHSAHRNQ